MKKKIKILYTIPNFDTAGSGKVVYDLVKGIDHSIFAPEICVFHTKGAFFKEIEKLNVPIHVFKFETDYRPFVSLLFRVIKISQFFKKHKFDIIHSWHWSSDFTEPLAAKIAGIPYVYTKKAMGWGNKSWLWRSKLSTKIIAINGDMTKDFFSSMLDKVVNLPLGVDTNYYKPQPKNKELSQQLNINDDDFVITSVVNMVPVKGIEVLLKAISKIKIPHIKVLIVGNDSSDYAQKLKTEFSDSNFLFLGKKNDVRSYIALADLFVIPTKDEGRKEGMPIAPLEAMAMGVPVIGSDISGIKDVLAAYPQLLFKASDVNDLAHKISTFKTSNNISKNELTSMIHDKFSLTSFIEKREQLYKSILGL